MTAAELKITLEKELIHLTQMHDRSYDEQAILEARLKQASLNTHFFMGRMNQLRQTITQVEALIPKPQEAK